MQEWWCNFWSILLSIITPILSLSPFPQWLSVMTTCPLSLPPPYFVSLHMCLWKWKIQKDTATASQVQNHIKECYAVCTTACHNSFFFYTFLKLYFYYLVHLPSADHRTLQLHHDHKNIIIIHIPKGTNSSWSDSPLTCTVGWKGTNSSTPSFNLQLYLTNVQTVIKWPNPNKWPGPEGTIGRPGAASN